MTSLEVGLRDLRATGRKALVPYFVAGLTADWTQHLQAAVAGGADAIEVGVPFSDPMMDGVVIQEAGLVALGRGTTLDSTCQELSANPPGVPLIVMSYYNIFLHYGLRRAAGRLRATGVVGAIAADLALEESEDWRAACAENDVASILLVAPSTPPARIARVTGGSSGFVYASARMAVTGPANDDGEAARVVAAIRAASDLPAYVGIGISTPDQAARAASFADGVIVGSALVKLILSGADVGAVEEFIRAFRAALDELTT